MSTTSIKAKYTCSLDALPLSELKQQCTDCKITNPEICITIKQHTTKEKKTKKKIEPQII